MRQHFAHRQTKSQNGLAFTMWLVGCSDQALASVDPASIARSYGIAISKAQGAIADEMSKRGVTRAG